MDRALHELSDEELVQQTLKQPDVYGILITRYKDKLLRYVRRISHCSKDDVEDILQDIFIKAYKNIAGFDTTLSFSSWIYRIAHNESVNFIRLNHKKIIHEYSSDNTVEETLFHKIAENPEQEHTFDTKLDADFVHKVLDTLDEKFKSVLVLRFIEDKDYKEISDILQKPQGTVATLINRAKKQFIQHANRIRQGTFT